MTSQNGNGDRPYEVGYGKPPVNKQFQKGHSGNPRGSKPKMEPSRTKLQLVTDFLSITEQPITIVINGKQKKVSGFQAAVMKLNQQVINGDRHAAKLFFEMIIQFMSDFANANPEITRLVESFHRHVRQQPGELDAATIREINKVHRKTRD